MQLMLRGSKFIIKRRPQCEIRDKSLFVGPRRSVNPIDTKGASSTHKYDHRNVVVFRLRDRWSSKAAIRAGMLSA